MPSLNEGWAAGWPVVDLRRSLKGLEGPVAHRLLHRRADQRGGGYSDQQIRSMPTKLCG